MTYPRHTLKLQGKVISLGLAASRSPRCASRSSSMFSFTRKRNQNSAGHILLECCRVAKSAVKFKIHLYCTTAEKEESISFEWHKGSSGQGLALPIRLRQEWRMLLTLAFQVSHTFPRVTKDMETVESTSKWNPSQQALWAQLKPLM